ncbi:TetR/AcrR family transcriptional regulator [Qipengyuania qiaonensis]|uniref:TetR/AcrR family transcriptional regulator n=1 Tax=Qipengyuania qiaonensis TaxID=2867240 RepID=A0ABS7J499_9SPHN|nr:TetR/AcrR family transcriptional regulator [Qipengyuania qiaonensis]MBX7482156.1 TetR/AcrR family transcriptional regulator [Qipengyuania qiaonensis]
MKKATRPRGRPPSLGREAMLDGMKAQFWSGGFSRRSMDELARAAGASKPSLYSAFGDKRAIYLEVLRSFEADLERMLRITLSGRRPLASELETFFAASVEFYTSGENAQLGCPILGTAVAEGVEEPEVREQLAGTIRTIDEAFLKRLRHAVDGGELAPAVPVENLTLSLSSLLHSIALRARAGTEPGALRAMTSGSLDLIFRQAGA